MRRRARQGVAGGTIRGAVFPRSEGTPASPSARTFARASSGGRGGPGQQRCSNTRCQPGSRRGCPCPDLSGPPCSHARASGPGTAGGHGSGLARRPQAPFRGHRAVGNRDAGGVTVTTRVCSGFASIAEVGAQCPVPKRERGRGRARSEAPSRAAPVDRRTGTAARAATRERERSLGAPRRRKVLFVRSFAFAVHAAGRNSGVGPS